MASAIAAGLPLIMLWRAAMIFGLCDAFCMRAIAFGLLPDGAHARLVISSLCVSPHQRRVNVHDMKAAIVGRGQAKAWRNSLVLCDRVPE